jgi:hypothetical protein
MKEKGTQTKPDFLLFCFFRFSFSAHRSDELRIASFPNHRQREGLLDVFVCFESFFSLLHKSHSLFLKKTLVLKNRFSTKKTQGLMLNRFCFGR